MFLTEISLNRTFHNIIWPKVCKKFAHFSTKLDHYIVTVAWKFCSSSCWGLWKEINLKTIFVVWKDSTHSMYTTTIAKKWISHKIWSNTIAVIGKSAWCHFTNFFKKTIFSAPLYFIPLYITVLMLMYLSIYLLIKKIVDIYDSSRITQIVPHNIHIYTRKNSGGK